MKHLFFILVLFSSVAMSQNKLSKLLKKHNDNSIPYISVQELAMPNTNAILLDSREEREFEVSHIKDAICVGYDDFDVNETIKKLPNKEDKIVVYCSLGIRSETIAKKLKEAGYTNIFNLYGGIFEWKNNGFTVIDSDNNETEKVHAFSKEWSKWLKEGEKIIDQDTTETKN
ncbi:rhodanese-like domain-containing protein [Olleya sp. R77988]|uniref:rhodanese-like domain-containing protein n=1 Tax=Olleya sp. R77988 TaxID=3093875 RepID=UPI0037C6134C